MIERWKATARKLKTEIRALALASRDPRTPWHAKAVVILVVAYALSPIDLILLPLGIAVALRLIPPEVMQESRERVRADLPRPVNWFAAAAIVLLWISLIVTAVLLWRRQFP